jgi:hypothetical protein
MLQQDGSIKVSARKFSGWLRGSTDGINTFAVKTRLGECGTIGTVGHVQVFKLSLINALRDMPQGSTVDITRIGDVLVVGEAQ